MTFSVHTQVVRLAGVALALGALVLAASMPTSSSFAECFAISHGGACAHRSVCVSGVADRPSTVFLGVLR
jgi:hypothetical protein